MSIVAQALFGVFDLERSGVIAEDVLCDRLMQPPTMKDVWFADLDRWLPSRCTAAQPPTSPSTRSTPTSPSGRGSLLSSPGRMSPMSPMGALSPHAGQTRMSNPNCSRAGTRTVSKPQPQVGAPRFNGGRPSSAPTSPVRRPRSLQLVQAPGADRHGLTTQPCQPVPAEVSASCADPRPQRRHDDFDHGAADCTMQGGPDLLRGDVLLPAKRAQPVSAASQGKALVPSRRPSGHRRQICGFRRVAAEQPACEEESRTNEAAWQQQRGGAIGAKRVQLVAA